MTTGGSQGGGPYGGGQHGQHEAGPFTGGGAPSTPPGSESPTQSHGGHGYPGPASGAFPAQGGRPGYGGNNAPTSVYGNPGTSPFPPQASYGGPGGGAYSQSAFGGSGGNPPPRTPKNKGGGRLAALGAGALVVALVAGGAGGAIGYTLADGSNGSSSSTSSGPLGGDPGANGNTAPVEAPAGSVQEVAARVLPSVVSIEVASGGALGSGSGVVLTEDGVIMTNNHVVSAGDNGPAAKVGVNFSDGSRAQARVLGADPISDIAVIKVDRNDLTPVTVGNSNNLAVGQDVIAIGSPLGLAGTVTTGIISALNRPVLTSRDPGTNTTSVIDAIQTDAAINPGNSGGALVNARGALIGINTAIATLGGGEQQAGGSIGLGFAIPIDQAIRVAKQLESTGKASHANIGVSVRPSGDSDAPGAVVTDVTPGGPAAGAGIPKDAVITKVDDRPIPSGDALVAAIRSHAPGDTVTVTYTDGANTKTAQVKLGTLEVK
ncbi:MULTISPECIES: trypsin-like peptidase domain-containing protein [Gordonia]|uniref:trypsin-like peptidase domain-containing protein n=1 Tax=Gordonia TaxID=2053 RepID=UPI0009626960|nr:MULTISPECIES: trypsin-like peptidase domain-containing protein [Gordonia]MDH3009432.1 trypsin-like peptidase domain-containing protein [Gordonia alkanivorans]MDH3027097.1 trypsin-like peptidase domain-containing protein [Gordonia alkanivorans]MDH3050942.1 trypsin-like peptidase domain-containing protein [Gordonia alkanivorans]OLT49548.1 peptidase S1 [Gordonia sp. CNJ-863]QGP87371.1 PDZ domain-containing protein [Gordonia sp. 135]